MQPQAESNFILRLRGVTSNRFHARYPPCPRSRTRTHARVTRPRFDTRARIRPPARSTHAMLPCPALPVNRPAKGQRRPFSRIMRTRDPHASTRD